MLGRPGIRVKREADCNVGGVKVITMSPCCPPRRLPPPSPSLTPSSPIHQTLPLVPRRRSLSSSLRCLRSSLFPGSFSPSLSLSSSGTQSAWHRRVAFPPLVFVPSRHSSRPLRRQRRQRGAEISMYESTRLSSSRHELITWRLAESVVPERSRWSQM